MNNAEWDAENCILSDSPLLDWQDTFHEVKANELPDPPLTSDELKSIFNDLRSQVTSLHQGFSRSGQMEADFGHIAGDLEFFQKYAKHNVLMFYAYLAWNRTPPAFCHRVLPAVYQSDVGISPGGGKKLLAMFPLSHSLSLSLSLYLYFSLFLYLSSLTHYNSSQTRRHSARTEAQSQTRSRTQNRSGHAKITSLLMWSKRL